MIKLTNLLKEIKVNNPNLRIELYSPSYGAIYIDNKPIGIEIYGDKIFLDEYDEDVYDRYGIEFDYGPDDDENTEYYPVEESEKLVQILLPKLSSLGAEIIDNGYGVSQIELPLSKAQRFIKHDYPKYLGDGKFEYNGKTITYRQPNPGVGTYEAYDSNDKLIRTFTSYNKDITNFMGYLQHAPSYEPNSPRAIISTLQEIRVNKPSAPTVYKPIPDNALYKVKNFPSVNTKGDILSNPYIVEILNKIIESAYNESLNQYLNYANPEYQTRQLASKISKLRPFQTAYIHTSGDGTMYFVNSLEEFNDGYKTEEDWGITGWEQI
jgi:hypothetical protein